MGEGGLPTGGGLPTVGRGEGLPNVLTSSSGQCSGRYASYWNEFLLSYAVEAFLGHLIISLQSKFANRIASSHPTGTIQLSILPLLGQDVTYLCEQVKLK